VNLSRFAILPLILSLAISAFAANDKAEKKLSRAEVAFQRQDFYNAEKLIREAIKDDPSSIEAHSMLANLLSATRRYSQAAPEYGRVLDLDAQQRKLSPADKRRAIDGQAVSYAEIGEFDRAKSLYLAALKDDPDYAMYNYNLACVYAELHDLDSAIPYLQKSWEKRDTLPADTRFPDPRQDSSFKAYLGDPKFQAAVRNMVQ
jgi:tetratricopeptide (TPR) repeat protein